VSAAPAVAQQDLRSPDARDAARLAEPGYYLEHPTQDLRSPDTRDATLISMGLREQPTTIAPAGHSSSTAATSSLGFDWADAAVGAAIMLGVLLVAAGGTVAFRRRAHRHHAIAG
jgi:hypothetical protein